MRKRDQIPGAAFAGAAVAAAECIAAAAAAAAAVAEWEMAEKIGTGVGVRRAENGMHMRIGQWWELDPQWMLRGCLKGRHGFLSVYSMHVEVRVYLLLSRLGTAPFPVYPVDWSACYVMQVVQHDPLADTPLPLPLPL